MFNKRRRKINYTALFLFLLWLGHLINNYIWLKLDKTCLTYDSHWHYLVSLRIFDAYKNFSYHILTDFIKATQLQPPLIGILTAPFYFLFGVTQDAGVMINAAIFLAVLIFSTYKLGEKLLNKKAGLLSAFLVTMYPVVFNQLKVYMLDLPLAAFVTLSIYFLLMTDNFRNFKYSVLFGISCGLGLLVKQAFPIFIIGPLGYIIIRNIFSFRSTEINNSKQWIINLTLSLTLAFFLSFIYYFEKLQILLYKIGFLIWVVHWPTPIPESNLFLHTVRSLLWYLWGLINWQVSFFYFLMFIIGVFFYSRVQYRNKSLLYVWILVSWILVGCFRYAISFNMKIIAVRYTMPLLPAVALITAVGIMQIPIKKIRFFSIVIVVIFGIFQLLFISYPIFNNWSSKGIDISIPLEVRLERYKLLPESVVIFNLTAWQISGSDHGSHPVDARNYKIANEEIFRIIDSSSGNKKDISIFILPDDTRLWYLQYISHIEKKVFNFFYECCFFDGDKIKNKEEDIVQKKIITADYIIDKDRGILRKDHVLGDVTRAKFYFNQNKDKFALLSKVKWPDGSNILVFKRINM